MEVIQRKKRGKDPEAGYVLVAVIFLLFLFTLSLSIAVPRMSKSIQQDRERETIRRGLQYRRAVQLYYRKFHAYPPSLEALNKTNNIRFLRKKYIDPTTGKEEWKPVLFGQNKVPVAMGFFGEPLKGTTLAGTGPSGGNAASTGLGSSSSAFGSSSGLGSSSSAFGSSSGTSSGSTTGGTDSSASAGSSGTGTSGTGTSGSSSSSSSSASSSSSSGFGGGQTFGGAGIIGFKPGGTRQSIFLWKKKNHPNEWEFTYDPISDQKQISGNTGSIGTSAASMSSPIGSSSTSSSSSGSSTSGSGTSSR